MVNKPGVWQRLKPISDVNSAVAALEWIVLDGEGTKNLPFDGSGELAHYYRFEQIFHGRELIEHAASPQGFAYGGAAFRWMTPRYGICRTIRKLQTIRKGRRHGQPSIPSI